MAAIHQHAHIRRASPFSSIKRAVASDSESDDEPPPEIKFSKVTEALLNDRYVPSSPLKTRPVHRPLRSVTAPGATLATPNKQIKIIRKSSPSALGGSDNRGSTPPRVVHVGSTGSARRTISISGPYPHRSALRRDEISNDIVTPAPASRVVRPCAGSNASQGERRAGHSSSSRPSSRQGVQSKSEAVDADALSSRLANASTTAATTESVSRFALSSLARSRPAVGDAAPTSQRVKRAPIAGGTFLKSGPVRRFRRRESDEEVSPTDDQVPVALSQPSSNGTPQHGSRTDGLYSQAETVSTRALTIDPAPAQELLIDLRDSSSRPGSRQDQVPGQYLNSGLLSTSRITEAVPQANPRRSLEGKMQPFSQYMERQTSQEGVRATQQDSAPVKRADSSFKSFRYVGDAVEDQENAPPTFKRNKEQEMKHLGRVTMLADDKPVPVITQPLVERKALHAVSNNTPFRAPPPPPKMSVLETATATVGASTTKSRKKRTHIVINGKIFTQMGRIGKGGSSEVFLVMAENFKTFAMKKVSLSNCDESAVRGFKGEIDLLKKLTDVDRVIRLYDWELNDEKKELLVLMEKGDTDLYRIMTLKNGGHDGKFDLTFTRYYWKEMLECVQAVHEHDIVHSDLKPANFLIVQGRLKLIDFGIANAIEVDHTCNVHRDSHVGTPNYMSPESINDTSGSGTDAHGRPLRKDMKIGKSSDVWSLGCILYQMTYGRPPFAHIPTIPRIMAITNPKHIIEFPDTGIGGVDVPSSLKGVLKRCLQREADLRPTIPQLLSEKNEFLHPEATGAVLMRQDILDLIINKVVERCQDTRRGMPQPSEIAQYAPDFMVKIRALAEKV